MISLILTELATPTGQPGPLSVAYSRAAGGVWHSVLGAAFCAWFGLPGLPLAIAVAGIYWALKEAGDIRRGGKVWDGLEDALMVSLGAWYGALWWPVMICGAGVYILTSAAWRQK